MRGTARLVLALIVLCAYAACGGKTMAGETARHYTGPYSFSDELGGFRILSASGSGTRDDPAVVVQELYSASPVTLVIRAETPIVPHAREGAFASGFIRLTVVARNASSLAWTEFEFELQQELGKPSDFFDGLSFDQRRLEGSSIASGAFARFIRDFEPYDRLLFTDGHVDPGGEADFTFLISDFTPEPVFYLVLDPRIPSS